MSEQKPRIDDVRRGGRERDRGHVVDVELGLRDPFPRRGEKPRRGVDPDELLRRARLAEELRAERGSATEVERNADTRRGVLPDERPRRSLVGRGNKSQPLYGRVVVTEGVLGHGRDSEPSDGVGSTARYAAHSDDRREVPVAVTGMQNLAVKVADLDEAVAFYERSGAEISDRMHWRNGERADVRLGPVMITLFTNPIYEDAVDLPAEAFLHPALFTDDLDAQLEGHDVVWGPEVVEGSFGKRRIAFVDAPGAIRLEFMEQLESPRPPTGRHALVPSVDTGRVRDAHARMLKTVAGLTEEDLRRPSLLPGWSVAHVLAHLARNADSHVHRVSAAVRAEVVDQYVGGTEGRAAEIEATAALSCSELLEQVRTSARAVDEAWSGLSPDLWTAKSRDANGMPRRLFELPSRRWQEVEVHMVDLDVGVTWGDWSDEFVREWLPRTRERMWPRMAEVARIEFDEPARELAWLYGRLRDDVPDLPPWG